jgi:hypothetical protein
MFLTITLAISVFAVDTAHAQRLTDRRAARMARTMSWHGPYYDAAWGAPLALVVPPTAHMQTKWAWGVSQGTMTPIYHQFGRTYPGEGEFGGMEMQPTPAWPSHSDQFGVYYVRGPW